MIEEIKFDPKKHLRDGDGFIDKTALPEVIAQYEANGIRKLVGSKGTPEEYGIAHKIIEDEYTRLKNLDAARMKQIESCETVGEVVKKLAAWSDKKIDWNLAAEIRGWVSDIYDDTANITFEVWDVHHNYLGGVYEMHQYTYDIGNTFRKKGWWKEDFVVKII